MGAGSLSGSVRIVGGEWRGRRLKIPAGTAVRPTPDRVRETVFNWLGPSLAGTSCLDLFAGTGAIGLEALSRGAAEVVLVERDRTLSAALEAAAAELGTARATVLRADAVALLAAKAPSSPLSAGRFGFVALDPPYRMAVEPLLEAVSAVLAPRGVVYVERAVSSGLPEVAGWHWHRRGQAAGVAFGLYERA